MSNSELGHCVRRELHPLLVCSITHLGDICVWGKVDAWYRRKKAILLGFFRLRKVKPAPSAKKLQKNKKPQPNCLANVP